MNRYIVVKNTLPYIHPWSVIEADTNLELGSYKNQKDAEKACVAFNSRQDEEIKKTPNTNHSAFSAFQRRMQKRDGDPIPKVKKTLDKRRVRLNGD